MANHVDDAALKSLKKRITIIHITPQVWFVLPEVLLLAPLLHSWWKQMRSRPARNVNPGSLPYVGDGNQDGQRSTNVGRVIPMIAMKTRSL